MPKSPGKPNWATDTHMDIQTDYYNRGRLRAASGSVLAEIQKGELFLNPQSVPQYIYHAIGYNFGD